MSPGVPGARPRIARLLLLVGLPLVVWLACDLGARLAVEMNPRAPEERLRSAAGRLQADFGRLLEEALRIAEAVLEVLPVDALRTVRNGAWHGRVEGVGVVGSDGRFLDWEGTPAEPPVDPEGADEVAWRIASEGLRVRLLVTSAATADGRSGLASFVLHSPLGDLPFAEVLPGSTSRGHNLDVEFLDYRGDHADVAEFFGEGTGVFREGDPSTLYAPLRSPSGEVLALASFQEIPASYRADRLRAAGRAMAAVALALLLFALFDWGALARTPVGLFGAVAALAVARAGLLLTRAPAYLLPREIGSPGAYGSARPFGLLGSPADLFLSALTLALAAWGLKKLCESRAAKARRGAILLASAGGVALVAVVVGLSISLAKHARIAAELFEDPADPLAQALLLSGFVLAMLAAAELGAVAWALAGGSTRRGESHWPSRLTVGVMLLPLAALSSSAFHVTLDRLARERLESEFAPQVLEQSARRQVALRAAVQEAAGTETAIEAVLSPPEMVDDFAAYRLWVAGELFHLGYKSSIDLYRADGEPVNHFGFDLPPFAESVSVEAESSSEPLFREEEYPVALAVPRRLLHAEAPILRDGTPVGVLVGHVLDEPDNLPFLPALEPYVSALGPPAGHGDRHHPDYVLYDRDGTVVLNTLHRPPPLDDALRAAAEERTLLRMGEGSERFVGLPLSDGDRVHLLLLPARPLLDRLAVFAKLFLVAVGALAILALIRSAVRHRGIGFVVTSVRESFHRKLLTTLLLASLLPLVGLALFLGGFVEQRAGDQLVDSAAQVISVVQRVVKDYAAAQSEEAEATDGPEFDDDILYWLRSVVGQEIHLYENELVAASSKRELFASGLLPPRLPGEIHRRVVRDGLPYLVLQARLGSSPIPVAYARVDLPGTDRRIVAAVPLILQQEEASRAAERVEEMLVLTTVLLALLVIAGTALIARTVARPVRELVGATARIAAGDYSARLEPRSRDEVAELVEKFNAMAEALAAQRADLERRRDYMQALLTNATTGVLSTDAEGRIVTLNPAAERFLTLGASRPRIGDRLGDLASASAELAPLARALERPAAAGETTEIDLALSGPPRRLALVRVPLPDPTGEPPGWLILLDDVTDLMRSNQLAAWAEMARAIAHEIKNPLTPIQLSTEHLERILRDRAVLPSPEVEGCLETVMKQVQALRAIAAEFSAYAKLPVLAPERTEPQAFMRDAIQPYRAAHPPGVTIDERYQPAPDIVVDRRVLTRAIVNLVENSLHAMNEGGTLTVGVEPDSDSGGTVLFIADSGPGLAPDVRARLFEPYFSTKSSGTGLGLAIVRQAAEAHQGTIRVESEKGRGTTFRIHLPAASDPPGDSARETG